MPRGETEATCRITGTLRWRDGRPARFADTQWRITFGPQLFTGHTRTDHLGRFSVVIKGVLQDGAVGRLTLQRGLPPFFNAIAPDWPAKEEAHVVLPPDLPRGEFDAGSLTFRLLPVVARGRVLDEDGRPVGGVMIDFTVARTREFREPWGYRVESRTNTGTFEIRCETDERRAKATFRKRGFLPRTFAFEIGRRNWRVVLRRSSGVLGNLLDVGEDVEIALTTSDGVTHRDDSRSWRDIRGGMGFAFTEVAPGPARILIRVDGRVLVRTTLDLPPGKVATPRALQDIPNH